MGYLILVWISAHGLVTNPVLWAADPTGFGPAGPLERRRTEAESLKPATDFGQLEGTAPLRLGHARPRSWERRKQPSAAGFLFCCAALSAAGAAVAARSRERRAAMAILPRVVVIQHCFRRETPQPATSLV